MLTGKQPFLCDLQPESAAIEISTRVKVPQLSQDAKKFIMAALKRLVLSISKLNKCLYVAKECM